MQNSRYPSSLSDGRATVICTSFTAVCRHWLNVLCSNVAVNQFMYTEHTRYTLFCFLKCNIYTKYELGR